MTLKRLGLWMIGVAVALIALAGAVIVHTAGPPFVDTLRSPIFQTPMHNTLNLQAGDYLVYENAANFSASPPDSGSLRGVTIVGPDTQPIPLSIPSTVQKLNRDGDTFSSVVEFHAPQAGAYVITVVSSNAATVVIGRDLGKLVLSILGWVALGLLGAAMLVAGVIMLIVARSKRRRETAIIAISPTVTGYPAGASNGWPIPISGSPTGAHTPAPAPPPRPGWYPDPEARHKYRWWNGQHWEAPLPDQPEEK
ncbi:uncharacterized protein DUF2510 [Jatrophihabitans sp. GAS493]|uniref:DUF2510 domain-containing protein n=1 Tax=Jatrophihabitans sp. GAS493 TaxID=1907575 RepID=UPI000BB86D2B|nr:DUF2510 domain-containing protein [Jatrophihabitans sp. GAS493]SOD74523.1 uncharacterized protein DUF2510 [Jatrophihabitans sp. GAS493]